MIRSSGASLEPRTLRYNLRRRVGMRGTILGVCGSILTAAAISAQQPTPPAAAGRGQATAPPPINWPSPPLPDGPLRIDTGLVRPMKLTILKGLTQPWSMAFVPEGILITERGGKLRMVRSRLRQGSGAQDVELDPAPVAGLPA